jgi:5-methylcytosine-specific restriction endonuclease McrA
MQPRDGWQADHIVPVSRGGGETGLDGLRTLCTEHHRVETKKLAQERAAERRAKRC